MIADRHASEQPAPASIAYDSHMPTYVYAIIKPDGTEGEVFEVFQKLTDPTLTHHPETGEPVRKLIVTPQVQTSSDTQRFSKNNLERLGFSRFERKGDGHYEKTAGTGPDTLNAGD